MDLIPLGSDRYAETARMLARAFQDDPMWSFVEPDAARRLRKTAWILEHWARLLAPLGASWLAVDESGAAVGAAMWLPPGEFEKVSTVRMLRAGYVWMPFALGFRWMLRSWRIFDEMVGRQLLVMREPCWVLDVLGVEPARQGEGIGRRLLEKGLARADTEAKPGFLVTHKLSNVKFYEHFGFRVVDEYQMSNGGPVAYSMQRPFSHAQK